jgi:two-component system, NarL family, sensor histidine kinase UhpB
LRLTIHLLVGALMLLFILAMLWLQLRHMRDSVNEEVVAANRVASQLLNRTVLGYAAQGTPVLLTFLQGLGRVRSNEITLFDGAGQPLYRSPPSPYKAGREAPRWFSWLVSENLPVQAIDLPDARLEVRADASRAVLDAWDDAWRLLVAALAFLLAVNLAVYALVGRATRPFAQITAALNRVQGGAFDAALPPLPGREAGAIGAAFNRMVAELRAHIDAERRAARAEAQLDENRALARWLDQRVEEERRLIARELHDELGQSVTAMRSMAMAIRSRTGETDATSADAAGRIAEEAARLYQAMHGLIPRLTPLVLDQFGLADAIRDLVERTRVSHTDLNIDAQVELGDEALSPELALTLYRAAQEGLTNALRHGRATRVQIVLRAQSGAVTLEVIDNGCGLPADGWQRPGHYGLRWLHERALSVGGNLAIDAAQLHAVRLSAPAA